MKRILIFIFIILGLVSSVNAETLFEDNFNDNSLNPYWTVTGTLCDETNQRLQCDGGSGWGVDGVQGSVFNYQDYDNLTIEFSISGLDTSNLNQAMMGYGDDDGISYTNGEYLWYPDGSGMMKHYEDGVAVLGAVESLTSSLYNFKIEIFNGGTAKYHYKLNSSSTWILNGTSVKSVSDTSMSFLFAHKQGLRFIDDFILYSNSIKGGGSVTPTLTFNNITANNITIQNDSFYNDTIQFQTFVLNTSTNSLVNHTYSLNGAAEVQYATNTLNGSVNLNLSENYYNISFRAFNNETNISSSNFSFIVDRTAPIINIIGNVTQDTYFVNFSTIFDVNYSISGKSSCSINITYLSNLSETDSNYFIGCEDTQVFTRAGLYNGFLKAEDNAGNIVTGSVNGTINPLINIFFNDTSNGTIILEYNATIFHPNGDITFPIVQPDGSIQLSPVNNGSLDLGNHTIQFQRDKYSLTNFTQLVNTTNAGTNTTFNVSLANINISILNRLDKSLITNLVNIQLIGPVGITSSTSNGLLNINSTVLVAGDYELITTSTNYFTESIFFTYNNQETIDLDVFMLNKTQTNQGQISIFVKNEFEELQPNILVKLLEYNNNTNSFTDVSQTLSDLNGVGLFNIELGTKKYIFRAISGDIIADSSVKGEFIFITDDSRTLILRQGQLQKIPLFKNFIYDVVENQTAKQNNISNIVVTWDDSDNLVNKVCIQYFKKTGITTIFLQEFCEESSSGILESNVILNLSQNSIVAEVVAFIDDSTNPLDSFTYLRNGNIQDVLNGLGFLDYIIFALVIIAIGIGIWMDIPAVGAGAVIGVSWWMVKIFPSFVNGTISALVTLICIGIIIAAVRRE